MDSWLLNDTAWTLAEHDSSSPTPHPTDGDAPSAADPSNAAPVSRSVRRRLAVQGVSSSSSSGERGSKATPSAGSDVRSGSAPSASKRCVEPVEVSERPEEKQSYQGETDLVACNQQPVFPDGKCIRHSALLKEAEWLRCRLERSGSSHEGFARSAKVGDDLFNFVPDDGEERQVTGRELIWLESRS